MSQGSHRKCRLGAAAQSGARHDCLAMRHRRRADQVKAAVSGSQRVARTTSSLTEPWAQFGCRGVDSLPYSLASLALYRVLAPSRPIGDTGAMIHIQSPIDDATCLETVRHLRWPEGVHCPMCDGAQITEQRCDETQPERQRYLCKSCEQRCADLTDTIFAGHHHPLRVWRLCLYCMGRNRSNQHIAHALSALICKGFTV